MSKTLKELKKQISPAVLKAAKAKTKKMLAELPLNELRRARELSQEQLADILHIRQASVSKLERRTDMYISTLRNIIRAMGGELEINAIFPEGVIKINQFQAIDGV
jgi:DNA-binding transcriptional regulator YiaG